MFSDQDILGALLLVGTLLLNVILLAAGLLLIGREFGVKTIYMSLLLPAVLGVLERMFPEFQSVMGDPFLDMLCFIFLVSVGSAILLNLDASSGGLDIVTKQEYLKLIGYISKIDPSAFVTVYNVNEVIYRPKKLPQ